MPVDDDKDGALAREAVKGHLANFRMPDFITEFKFRDDALPYDPSFTGASFSPYNYLDEMPKDVAVYAVSGWMDGAGYANGALSRFLTLPNAKRRAAGPVGSRRAGQRLAVARAASSPSCRCWAKCCASSTSIWPAAAPGSATRTRSTISPCMPRNGARPRAGRR